MIPVIILGLVVGCSAVTWLIVASRRRARISALMRAPFPEEWRIILTQNLPPYAKLPEPLRKRLEGSIHVFLDDKHIEGCGGQEITDEIRVTIAAQACLLLLGRDSRCYPKLKSVLVYPHTYVAGGKGVFGSQDDPPSVRLGESWQSGAVVLSWNSVKGGAVKFYDGHHVPMHEFAHQLDQEDGASDGTPILGSLSAYASWAHCLTNEYRSFLKRVGAHKKTVIDEYGATNAAEFFATASETFFERPQRLQKKRPDLFAELKHYYNVDPTDWS